MKDQKAPTDGSRRSFLITGLKALLLAALGGVGLKTLLGARAARSGGSSAAGTVWQIDPSLCTHCGNCGKNCVLHPSAVKVVHAYDVCGYCDLCGAYFTQSARSFTTGAENRICPTGAIIRTYIEDPYYQYTVSEALCTGCAKCALACTSFGNGSLFMQIRHDRCAGCNECSCAKGCPARAIRRVPRSSPYLLKKGAPRA